jgi:hypothetical protein
MKPGARLPALAVVDIRVSTVPGSASSRLTNGSGRGVVVTIWRGSSPSRRPNCSMSKVSSACFHFASSSHHAA